MKMSLAILNLRLKNNLQYRVAALAGVATQFFWGAIMIMIYMAFYNGATTINGFKLNELVTYIWLQQAFLVFVALWYRDNELFELIRTGDIAYEMCRPIRIYDFWFLKLLGTRLAGAILRCMPILLVAMCLPTPYRLILPQSVSHFLLFLVALLLGLLINVAISMFIYISVFVTLSPMGSLLLFSVIGEFFSGLVLPIPLMPQGLRSVVYALPFRYTADLPFRIYSGNIGVLEGLQGLLIQVLWLVILLPLGQFLMQKALKNIVVQGG